MFGPSSIWGLSLYCVFQRDQCMDRWAAELRNVTALLIVTGQDNWNTSMENTSGHVWIYHVISYAMFLLPSKTGTLPSTYMSLIDTAHRRCKGLCGRGGTVVILEKNLQNGIKLPEQLFPVSSYISKQKFQQKNDSLMHHSSCAGVLTGFRWAGFGCVVLAWWWTLYGGNNKVSSLHIGTDDWKQTLCRILCSHSELYNATVQALQISVYSTFFQANIWRVWSSISSVFSSEAKHTFTVAFWGTSSIALGPCILSFPLLLKQHRIIHLNVFRKQTWNSLHCQLHSFLKGS